MTSTSKVSLGESFTHAEQVLAQLGYPPLFDLVGAKLAISATGSFRDQVGEWCEVEWDAVGSIISFEVFETQLRLQTTLRPSHPDLASQTSVTLIMVLVSERRVTTAGEWLVVWQDPHDPNVKRILNACVQFCSSNQAAAR